MQDDRGTAQNERTTPLFHTVSLGVRPPKCSGFQYVLRHVFAFPCESYYFHGKKFGKKIQQTVYFARGQMGTNFVCITSRPFLALQSVTGLNIRSWLTIPSVAHLNKLSENHFFPPNNNKTINTQEVFVELIHTTLERSQPPFTWNNQINYDPTIL